jgi:hypothetical protein
MAKWMITFLGRVGSGMSHFRKANNRFSRKIRRYYLEVKLLALGGMSLILPAVHLKDSLISCSVLRNNLTNPHDTRTVITTRRKNRNNRTKQPK